MDDTLKIFMPVFGLMAFFLVASVFEHTGWVDRTEKFAEKCISDGGIVRRHNISSHHSTDDFCYGSDGHVKYTMKELAEIERKKKQKQNWINRNRNNIHIVQKKVTAQ